MSKWLERVNINPPLPPHKCKIPSSRFEDYPKGEAPGPGSKFQCDCGIIWEMKVVPRSIGNHLRTLLSGWWQAEGYDSYRQPPAKYFSPNGLEWG